MATVPVDTKIVSLADLGSKGSAAVGYGGADRGPTLRRDSLRTYMEFAGGLEKMASGGGASESEPIPYTTFSVGRYRTANTSATDYWGLGGFANHHVSIDRGTPRLLAWRGTTIMSTPSLFPGTDWHVVIGVFALDATSVIRMDNQVETIGSNGLGAFTEPYPFTFPSNSSATDCPPVDIAEAGYFDRALDKPERDLLAAALMAAYQIS